MTYEQSGLRIGSKVRMTVGCYDSRHRRRGISNRLRHRRTLFNDLDWLNQAWPLAGLD